MTIFHSVDYDNHEQVVFVTDQASGLRGIIAVHSTQRGPALGGCRMYPYASEADALRDVLRLSRGMSYKAACADVALGGGKAVIIGDPRHDKSEALLRAFGRAIDQLGGRYITGEDVGTNPSDMAIIRRETKAVSCLDQSDGGYGDPAIYTALGAFQAITAGLEGAYGDASLKGIRVAVQGVGNVGYRLCAMLAEAGASLIVCDPVDANAERAAQLGARRVAQEEIYSVDADVFAPCAIGSVLHSGTIPKLLAKVVAGAANNQLATPADAAALAEKGIVYVPDYVANGGGLIACAAEWYRTDPDAIRPAVLDIFETCRRLIESARALGVTTSEAADALARERFNRTPSIALAQHAGV